MSRTADALRTTARGLGQTLITLGLVVLLFCVYELYVTNLFAGREQQALAAELDRAWAAEPAALPGAARVEPPLGEALARMHLPTLDDDARTVVEGVSVEDLKKGGPGHIPGTALPGEVGNTVYSGHRTTYGATFADVDALAPGDPVVLETQDTWFTYVVTGTEIVRPDAIEVTFPVPRQEGVAPTEAVLTLTTCHPRYSARQRMVVSAVLESEQPKADGRPPALAG